MALQVLCSELCDRLFSRPDHPWVLSRVLSGSSWERQVQGGRGCCLDVGLITPSSPLCGRAVAHTPDNSFMGFVSEELNETEKQLIKDSKASNMAVVYGKEASIWKVSRPPPAPGRPTAPPTVPARDAGHAHRKATPARVWATPMPAPDPAAVLATPTQARATPIPAQALPTALSHTGRVRVPALATLLHAPDSSAGHIHDREGSGHAITGLGQPCIGEAHACAVHT